MKAGIRCLIVAANIFIRPGILSAFLIFLCGASGSIASPLQLAAIESCFINQHQPDVVYNGTELQLQDASAHSGYSDFVLCPLIRYDLSSVPANVHVRSAVLELTVSQNGNPSVAYEQFGIYRITSGWNETSATWNSRPYSDAVHSAVVPRREAGVDTPVAMEKIDVDITGLVQNWCDGTLANNGVLLAMTSGSEWGKYLFYSDSAAVSVRPKLIIDYAERMFSTMPLQQDSYVFKKYPDQNYGSQGVVNLWDISAYAAYSNTIRSSLLQFDLSSLPFGAVIESADLDLIVNTAGNDQSKIDIRRCETAWEENSVCWTNRPSLSNHVYAELSSRPAPAAYAEDIYDISALVREWQYRQRPNYGLSIQYETNTFWGTLGYYSSEWSGYAPVLAITYWTNVFNVCDYGAQGNGSSDDTAAILAALSAADASEFPAEVFLPAGTYRISSTNTYALQLSGFSDVCIRGAGTNTILLVSNPGNGGIAFENSTNVMVMDVVVDYDPAPFTQGTVSAVDTANGTFDLQIDSGCLELDDPCFSHAESKWGLKVDLSRQAYDVWAYFVSSWTNIGVRTWRMKADSPSYLAAHPLSVGDRYAHMARRWDAFGISCYSCSGVRLENCTIHAAAGLSTGMINSGGIAIKGLHVGIKPGSTRLLSSNGDGIHASGCVDGLRIEDCSFEGMPDDGINIHGRGGIVISNVTDTVKRIGTPRTPAVFAVGDSIQVCKPAGVYSNAVILGAVQVNDVVWEITLDRALPSLTAGWGNGDTVANLSRCGQGSSIIGSFFGAHRGRDVVLRSHDITVADNYFFNPSFAWISVSLQYEYWYFAEAPASYNVDVRGNCFEGGTNRWPWSCASVGIHSYSSSGVQAVSYDSYNVLVESNTFINIDGPAVEATSVRDVQVIDNTVDVASGIKAASQPAILLGHADGIQINGLDILDLNPATYAAVHIKNTVPLVPGAVVITNLTAMLAPGSVVIRDER